MSNLYWLMDEQMARLWPFFPKSHGKPRVDDRRVLSGIIFINRNGLRWSDAPKEYGPAKTLYRGGPVFSTSFMPRSALALVRYYAASFIFGLRLS